MLSTAPPLTPDPSQPRQQQLKISTTAGAAVDHVQHQLAGRPCAGGEGDRAIAVEQGVVRQGGGALL